MVCGVANANECLDGDVHHVGVLVDVHICHGGDFSEQDLVKLHRMLILALTKQLIRPLLRLLNRLLLHTADSQRPDHAVVPHDSRLLLILVQLLLATAIPVTILDNILDGLLLIVSSS